MQPGGGPAQRPPAREGPGGAPRPSTRPLLTHSPLLYPTSTGGAAPTVRPAPGHPHQPVAAADECQPAAAWHLPGICPGAPWLPAGPQQPAAPGTDPSARHAQGEPPPPTFWLYPIPTSLPTPTDLPHPFPPFPFQVFLHEATARLMARASPTRTHQLLDRSLRRRGVQGSKAGG